MLTTANYRCTTIGSCLSSPTARCMLRVTLSTRSPMSMKCSATAEITVRSLARTILPFGRHTCYGRSASFSSFSSFSSYSSYWTPLISPPFQLCWQIQRLPALRLLAQPVSSRDLPSLFASGGKLQHAQSGAVPGRPGSRHCWLHVEAVRFACKQDHVCYIGVAG